jgi:hypothetical protein
MASHFPRDRLQHQFTTGSELVSLLSSALSGLERLTSNPKSSRICHLIRESHFVSTTMINGRKGLSIGAAMESDPVRVLIRPGQSEEPILFSRETAGEPPDAVFYIQEAKVATHLINGLPQSSSVALASLWMRFPIVTSTLVDVLPVAIVVAVQSIRYKGVCPYPVHLFIDVLAKVGYIKKATSIVQVRIHQVSSEAFEHG